MPSVTAARNHLVHKDIVLSNWVKNLYKNKEGKDSTPSRVGGAKISTGGADNGDDTNGAELIWKQDEVIHKQRRQLGLLHRGISYSSTLQGGFYAVDAETGKILAKRPTVYHHSHISADTIWFIAAGNRVITDGILQWTTGDEGLRPLPGRLAIDMCGGYAAPTLPAFSDGRLILRTSGKLLCYDLRKAANYDTDVIELTAKDVLQGEQKRDVAIRVRCNDNDILSFAVKEQRNRTSVYVGSDIQGLQLTDKELSGEVLARVSRYHYEPWSIKLTRDGNNFTGTYTRRAIPVAKPITTSDSLSGSESINDDGTRTIMLYLNQAAGSAHSIKEGSIRGNLSSTSSPKATRSFAPGPEQVR